jgi:hypothetical protein
MTVRGQCYHRGGVGKDLPIAFASRGFNKAERNYTKVEKVGCNSMGNQTFQTVPIWSAF